ncbi:MAG: hypothetical protein WCD80_13845 [Desulfobaccales bacterium]
MRKLTVLLMTMAFLMLSLGSAYGFSVVVPTDDPLDFGVESPTTGTIDYGFTSATQLVGTDIQVDNIVGVGTPQHPGVTLVITGGLLNFTSAGGAGFSFDANHWNWASSGPITITGGIADLGIADGTLLMSGTFQNVTVNKVWDQFLVTTSVFIDTKNETLVDYFYHGAIVPSWTGAFNISFAVDQAPDPGGFFISNPVVSGNVWNTPESIIPIPLPPSVWLLGSGLLGLLGLRRKFFS